VTEADLGEVKGLVRRLTQVLEPVEVFTWGPLGAEFWIEHGEALGCNRKQIRFAATLALGASQAQAARVAGFHCTANGRRAGNRVAGSPRVQRLMELAEKATERRRVYG
jgi:hypothetical protein